MTVRKGCIGDLEAVRAICAECFTEPWSEESLRHAFSDTVTEFAVIADADGVYGYAQFTVISEDAEIIAVAVTPARRRQGAGRALMESALARSAERGADRCFLEVRESNGAARALYASLGFTVVRTVKSYYRRPTENAVVMSRAF